MSEIVALDEIDKMILNDLISNARTPILTIARKIGVSGAAIHQRLKKLEKSGLILGMQAKIDPKRLGYKTIAFIGVFFDRATRYQDAIEEIKNISEVLECYYTTGSYSLLIKVITLDNEHLMSILNGKIQKIRGVSRTETFISLYNPIKRQLKL